MRGTQKTTTLSPHRPLAARPPSVARLAPSLARGTTTRPTRSRPPRAEGGDGDGAGSSSSGSAGTSPGAPPALADDARAAVLARIAAAKKYASGEGGGGGGAGPSASPAAPPPPAVRPPPPPPQQQQTPSWMRAAGGGGGAFPAPAASALPLPPFGGDDEDEASRAPPRRADFYTAEGEAAPALPDLLASAPPRLDGGSADRPASWLAGVMGGGGGEGGGAGGGGGGGFDGSAMRAEAFTQAREALQQQQGATIISADPNYDPGFVPPPPSDDLIRGGGDTADAVRELRRQQREQKQRQQQQQEQQGAGAGAAAAAGQQQAAEEDDDGHPWGAYRPKVSTWGVFERPPDISAAYGGGRTLKPGGKDLESAEQKEARERDYKTALAAYRKKAGLEAVPPEKEAAARAGVERADALVKAGKLREAAAAYEEARALVPLRTTLGGRATLGAAIALDSLGRGDRARELYRALRGHPDAATARTAKRLTFGFDAAKFLKADTITYARGNKEYAKYFRSFSDRNTVWAATEEELERDRAAARRAALLAIGIVAAPVAGVLALVAGGR